MQFVYWNGQHLPSERAKISCSDRGFLLGDGVFTTLKYSQHKLWHFPQHVQRLQASCAALFIPCHYDESELAQIVAQVIQNNQLNEESAAVRITITRGQGTRGLEIPESVAPSILVTAVSYVQSAQSVSLTKSSVQRHSSALTTRHKTLNYLDAIVARQEAKREGFADAIFCNENNFILSATTANLFFIENGVIKTPALQCGVLPGIQRQHILNLCKEKKITVVEGEWKYAELLQAEEIFLTNSLIGILPVHQIDHQSLPTDKKRFAVELMTYLEKS